MKPTDRRNWRKFEEIEEIWNLQIEEIEEIWKYRNLETHDLGLKAGNWPKKLKKLERVAMETQRKVACDRNAEKKRNLQL